MFFFDAGAGPFGVTASHVIKALRAHKAQHKDVTVQMGGIS